MIGHDRHILRLLHILWPNQEGFTSVFLKRERVKHRTYNVREKTLKSTK